jgi:SAM-dependent methyltransferase/GT2 family glycosyltransferase
VIIVGVCVSGTGERFRTGCEPALRRVLAPEDRVLAHPGDNRGIPAVYNTVLKTARTELDCAGVVFLHDDVEIVDPSFRAKVLAALAEPQAGVVGVVGGRGLVDARWWNARETAGRVFESRYLQDLGAPRADVDVVDGLFLALTPAVFGHITVDEDLPLFHGYDVDICLQARDLGLRVAVRQIELLHRTKGGFGDERAYAQANARLLARHTEWFTPLTPIEQGRAGLTRSRHEARRITRGLRRRSSSAIGRIAATFTDRVTAPAAVAVPQEPGHPEKSVARPEPEACVCVACQSPLTAPTTAAGPKPDLLRCPTCGSRSIWPRPRRDVQTDGIWQQQFGGQRLARRADWFAEARQRIEWILLHQPEGVLVEVGAGTGEFAKVAQEAGFDTHAVEPSRWAVGHARELGVPVHEGTLDQWADAHPGLLADVVAMWHVLEHVPNPRALLRQAAAITRHGGLVVLEVPNGASSECDRLGIEWDAAQPNDHVILFTPQGLRAVAEAAGLEVIEILEIPDRLYVGADAWRRRRNTALVDQHPWPPKDLLRMIARRPPATD